MRDNRQNSSELLKARLYYARELIKVENYEEARRILLTTNHPTAQRWLKKLDDLEYRRGAYQSVTQPSRIVEEHPIPPPPFTFPQSSNSHKQPSKTRATRKKRSHFLRNSIILILSFFLCIFFSVTSMINNSSTTFGSQTNQQQSASNISSRMLSIMPETIEISDASNTGIPRNFLDSVRIAVAPYGYVLEYRGAINRDTRFLSDVYIILDETNNRASAARATIEAIFRLYANQIDNQLAGEITTFVEWERAGINCGTSAGIGYRTLQEINWNNVSQTSLFNAINKNIYEDGFGRGDGLSGKPYSEVAWAPMPSALNQCNE